MEEGDQGQQKNLRIGSTTRRLRIINKYIDHESIFDVLISNIYFFSNSASGSDEEEMTMGDFLSSIKKRKRADVMQASRECLVKNYGKDHAFIMDLEINDHSKSRSNKGVRPQKARLSDLTFENI